MELVQTDRRRSPRVQPNRAVKTVLTIGGHPHEGVLRDYSIKGVSLKIDTSNLRHRIRADSDVELTIQGVTYPARLLHQLGTDDGTHVGLGLDLRIGNQELSFAFADPGWDLVEDPEALSTILKDLVAKGPEVTIAIRQLGGCGTLLPRRLAANGSIVADVFSMERGRLTEGTASFRFEIFQTCHAFSAQIVSMTAGGVEIETPKQLARLLRRETVRVPNRSSEDTLRVLLESPVLRSHAEAIPLYDFSEHGLSIVDPSGWACAPVGLPIERITVFTPQGTKIFGRGTIRTHHWNEKENGFIVGLWFETDSYEDRTHWHNMVLEARYPSLSLQYTPPDHKTIWELFERSGYLDIKPRDSFTHVYDITKGTWSKLSDAGTRISKRVLIRRNDEVVGHLQMDRIYPLTWCVHHLAIDPSLSKVIGKELYSVTADVVSAEGAQYVISLTDSAKPWNQRNYYDFIKSYRFPEDNEIRKFQVYEVDVGKPWNLDLSPQLTLRPATKWDLKRVVRYFEIHGSKLEREACGLTPGHLDLATLGNEYCQYGLSRAREFIVANFGNEMAGFARVETGSGGVNIFGLLDMLYIHILPSLKIDRRLLQDTLLDAALRRYAELGKRDVIVALDFGEPAEYAKRGLTFVFEGARWITVSATARRYHAYTQMLYGHLIFARERIHKRVSRE